MILRQQLCDVIKANRWPPSEPERLKRFAVIFKTATHYRTFPEQDIGPSVIWRKGRSKGENS